MAYHEAQDIRTKKALKHQEAALKKKGKKNKDLSNTEIVPSSNKKNPKTLIGHRLESTTPSRSGRAGRFYTIYPQNRGEKVFKLEFENLFEVPQSRVKAFEGLPAESLVLEWFPGVDWRAEERSLNIESGYAMDIRVAHEAVKRGYDGIKYGDLEIQDLKCLDTPNAPLPKSVINVQDIVYKQMPRLLKSAIINVTKDALYYAKNHGFNELVSIDEDVTRVLLSSIKPTQFGEDYGGESSDYQAARFQEILNGETFDGRKEDYYPLLVERGTGKILDGNHRHCALSKVKSPYVVVLYVTAK